MRYLALYTAIIALTAISCSTNRSFTMEDDIYYVPGKKALMVKEVENLTGQEISSQFKPILILRKFPMQREAALHRQHSPKVNNK